MKQMTDDHSLIEKILAGDRQAFRWLIKRYERLIGHVVGRIVTTEEDREEVCQDVFLKIHDKLDTFRGDSKLSTWMVTIAYRTSLNFIERRKNETVSLSDARDIAVAPSGLADLEQRELRKSLEEAISRLPLPYRVAITLFHLEEHSYEEMCEITGLSPGTVKSNLFRGRKLLKELLEKKNFISRHE